MAPKECEVKIAGGFSFLLELGAEFTVRGDCDDVLKAFSELYMKYASEASSLIAKTLPAGKLLNIAARRRKLFGFLRRFSGRRKP